MDTHANDQVSISSSCEIVDALLEASEDMVEEDVTKDTDEKDIEKLNRQNIVVNTYA